MGFIICSKLRDKGENEILTIQPIQGRIKEPKLEEVNHALWKRKAQRSRTL